MTNPIKKTSKGKKLTWFASQYRNEPIKISFYTQDGREVKKEFVYKKKVGKRYLFYEKQT